MRTLLVAALTLGAAGTAAAQGPPPVERLREQVVQRFLENYRVQAGLTDEQYARLQTAVRRSWEERRALQERERALMRGLEGQMRPGVAADADSVTQVLDALLEVQAQRVELARREQGEFAGFLSPVQRAQLVIAFTRLERQIEQVLERRREGMGRRMP